MDTDLAELARNLHQLSRGSVRKISASGPVLAPRPRRKELSTSTFTAALSPRSRFLVAVLSLGWAACLAGFWRWWLAPAHRTSTAGLVVNSAILFYLTCYPVFFVLAVNRLRLVSPAVKVPRLRVAFAVTRAPSEPWDLAQSTLRAMKAQHYPHDYDVWLCDEDPSPAITAWCVAHGVSVATRKAKQDYHRDSWPRRTRCKEGNLAYFYDHWGYRHYDVVVQLDCDHRPSPGYLAEMVRPFADPAVGYVAAPSVCDANAAASWAARGRLYREATFHGAFQLGHSDGWAPACIGSHYAVRTTALQDIGGLGPELAEDFSTSFLLNAVGWHGAFAITAEAHGDGPNTFAAMLVQEFQWSRSLTTILLRLVPPNLLSLPWPLRFRFIYALFFYSLLVSGTLGGLVLALAAAITGTPWVHVNYVAFLLHWWSISGWLVLITLFLRRRGLLRPPRARVVSWETWLYTLARWPYIARGIGAALIHLVSPRPTTFKVTPKGAGELEPLPARLMTPYLLISAASAGAALYGETRGDAVGYVFLCLLAALAYSVVSVAVPVLHAAETAARCHLPIPASLRETAWPALILGVLSLVPIAVALARYPAYAFHLLYPGNGDPAWLSWLPAVLASSAATPASNCCAAAMTWCWPTTTRTAPRRRSPRSARCPAGTSPCTGSTCATSARSTRSSPGAPSTPWCTSRPGNRSASPWTSPWTTTPPTSAARPGCSLPWSNTGSASWSSPRPAPSTATGTAGPSPRTTRSLPRTRTPAPS
jgi:cellulose synthase/poly-beta-1,6-N-acetylglucosamine synthase-like glycosyltransferase